MRILRDVALGVCEIAAILGTSVWFNVPIVTGNRIE
jgi:hypothetical protein